MQSSDTNEYHRKMPVEIKKVFRVLLG